VLGLTQDELHPGIAVVAIGDVLLDAGFLGQEAVGVVAAKEPVGIHGATRPLGQLALHSLHGHGPLVAHGHALVQVLVGQLASGQEASTVGLLALAERLDDGLEGGGGLFAGLGFLLGGL